MKFIYVDGEGYISLSLVKRAEPCLNGINCQLWADLERRRFIGLAKLAEFERLIGIGKKKAARK